MNQPLQIEPIKNFVILVIDTIIIKIQSPSKYLNTVIKHECSHHCFLFDESIQCTHVYVLTFTGFARAMSVNGSGQFTDYVATRWYRSPELLLG